MLLNKILKFVFPKSIMGRTLLILLAPMACLQAVMGFVFYDQHIEERLHYSASRIASEMSYIRTIYEKNNKKTDFLNDFSLALGRNYKIKDTEKLLKLISDCNNDSFITKKFEKYFKQFEPESKICDYDNRHVYMIIIPISNTMTLSLLANKKEFLSSKWHFIPVWSIATAIILGIIAALFLKNQIRAIVALSDAATAFGRGDNDFHYHPSGAIEVRHAGLAFIKMRRKITEFISSQTMMLAGISHDLRTILTRFKLELSMMPQSEETDNLSTDVKYMNTILNHYFDYVKATENEDPKPTELAFELSTLLKRYETPNKIIESFINFSDTTITLRKNGFFRCIINLLSNALRYGNHIKISVTHKNSKIKLIIEDNGIGVDEKNYEKIFDPFYSDNAARTLNHHQGERIGLGLSIARNIARSNGGDIMASRSEELGGLKLIVLFSTFYDN